MTNQTPLPHAVELLTDAQLGKIANDGYDRYWTEDCKGIEMEAWTAAAMAVLAAATPAQEAPEAVALPSPQARALLDIAQYLAGHLQMVQDRIDAALATPSEAVPSPSAAEEERRAFEAWLGRESFTERSDSGKYVSAHVDAMWSAWQARIALQKAKGPGMRTEASEAGQEPPTHAGSVAPGEGLL